MFLPDNLKDASAEKKRIEETEKAIKNIERWSIELIPKDAEEGVVINVQEVQCGDPDCSPIDTAVAILFPRGGRGMFGIPMEAKSVQKQDLANCFPPQDILSKWSRGEEAEWPPLDFGEDDEEYEMPKLRFQTGQRVECRTGPDPITGWARGQIIQLWYRESGWPPNSYAPYKILLDTGTEIFAPADQDHVIRAESSP